MKPTSEFKGAIQKIYLSSDTSQCEGSTLSSEHSVMSPTPSEAVSKPCVIGAIPNSPSSVRNHAIQAFQLLSSSSKAQAVVASIANDPNIWKAVLQNPAVNNFILSHQTVADFEGDTGIKEVEDLHCAADSGSKTSENLQGSTDSQLENGSFNLKVFPQKLKLLVTKMMTSLSTCIQRILPKPPVDSDGSAKPNFMDLLSSLIFSKVCS